MNSVVKKSLVSRRNPSQVAESAAWLAILATGATILDSLKASHALTFGIKRVARRLQMCCSEICSQCGEYCHGVHTQEPPLHGCLNGHVWRSADSEETSSASPSPSLVDEAADPRSIERKPKAR
jgi:hypothetical protein